MSKTVSVADLFILFFILFVSILCEKSFRGHKDIPLVLFGELSGLAFHVRVFKACFKKWK